jgi:ABC-2 type transport system ATP-binding protein
MPATETAARAEELLAVLGLSGDADVAVADYSAGMTKKIGLATAMLHAPRLLVLDEPFEAVDPVSGQAIRTILRRYVAGGGTVVMSSHVMELVEGLCDHVAVIADGQVLAAGVLDDIRGSASLHDRFLELVGGSDAGTEGLSWLGS